MLISVATNWFGTQSPLMCVRISWRVPRTQPIFSSSRRDGAAAAHFVLPFCSIQLRQQNLFENCREKRPKIRLIHSSKKRKKDKRKRKKNIRRRKKEREKRILEEEEKKKKKKKREREKRILEEEKRKEKKKEKKNIRRRK